MQKRWALSVPLDGFTLAEHADVAREMEGLGYTDAWSLEVDGVDIFSPLAVVGQATGMRVGSAIANVFTRGPATLAMSAAGVGEIAPGRFVLGVGSGSRPIVELWNGGRFERPVTRVRETIGFLRSALAGERVTMKGETVSAQGFRLTRPPASPIPIHVAALRPGMLRAAGEMADGVIINWLSAKDARRAVAVAREAASEAGRDPAALEVVARLMISVDPPSPESDTFMRRHICAYLTVPVYRAFHVWLGRREALTPMWRAWDAGDRRGAVAAVPEQVIDNLILHGTMEEVRAHVGRYLDAGVDTAVLRLLTRETDPARMREVQLQALRALAPGAG